jgi:hypothetical protein
MSGVISVQDGALAGLFQGELQYEDVAMAISRGGFPNNYSSSAYEKSAIVKTGRCTLYGFTCRTSRVSSQYIQVFDLGKVPASSAVPRFFIDIAAVSTLFVNYGRDGRRFDAGCIIVNSTTDTTYTAGSADCWFDVQYV